MRETPAIDILAKLAPMASGKSLGKPIEIEDPAGRGFVFLKVIV